MFAKRFIAFALILSLVAPAIYAPFLAPKAQAFLGFNFVIDVKALAERIVDGVAMVTAGIMVDQMVRSTVNWAQSGFDGNPAFVTNPERYFEDLADGIAGEFIAGSDLSYLCSPFQTQIRLALQRAYVQERQFQCTLTDVVQNIEAFYDDFNQGGWDAWFAMTQNSQNNPYGAYLEAQMELDSRIAEKVGLKREQLTVNSGFLNFEKCPAGSEEVPDGTGGSNCFNVDQNGQRHLASKQTVTPGVAIKEQLDRALPAGMEKLISVQHVEQLVSAFLNGLLSRYVFGPQGLFSRGGGEANQPVPTPPGEDLCAAARRLPGFENLDENCNPINPPPEPVVTPPKEPDGGELQS